MKKLPTQLIIAGIVLAIIAATLAYVVRLPSSVTGTVGTPLVQNEPYRVIISTDSRPTVGAFTNLLIEVQRNGQRSDVYANDRILHVILSSANRKDFLHTVSATEEEAGLYSVPHVFTQSGRYRVWVEVDHYVAPERHGEHANLLAYVDLEVKDSTVESIPARLDYTQESVQVVLTTAAFTAGQPSIVSWQVHNQDDVALPLLPDEPAISVFVGPDLDFFWHGHAGPPARGTDVEIPITFSEAGNYLLWTETYARVGARYEPLVGQFLLEVAKK